MELDENKGGQNMSKKTCAWCKKRIEETEAFVKHAGKHNTYYCSESEFQLAMERKKKREENKRRQQQLEAKKEK